MRFEQLCLLEQQFFLLSFKCDILLSRCGISWHAQNCLSRDILNSMFASSALKLSPLIDKGCIFAKLVDVVNDGFIIFRLAVVEVRVI